MFLIRREWDNFSHCPRGKEQVFLFSRNEEKEQFSFMFLKKKRKRFSPWENKNFFFVKENNMFIVLQKSEMFGLHSYNNGSCSSGLRNGKGNVPFFVKQK